MTETIGTLLKQYRKKADISKAELARRVGVGRELITRWEEGTTENISLPYLVDIMNALGVQIKITFIEDEAVIEEQHA